MSRALSLVFYAHLASLKLLGVALLVLYHSGTEHSGLHSQLSNHIRSCSRSPIPVNVSLIKNASFDMWDLKIHSKIAIKGQRGELIYTTVFGKGGQKGGMLGSLL